MGLCAAVREMREIIQVEMTSFLLYFFFPLRGGGCHL